MITSLVLETRIYCEIPAAARRQNDGKGMAEVLSLWNMNSSAQHGSTAARCGLERSQFSSQTPLLFHFHENLSLPNPVLKWNTCKDVNSCHISICHSVQHKALTKSTKD